MYRFYENIIRWNLPSSKREHAEELAHYVGHELADREITGDELERELVISYYELKELHEESNVTLAEWSQWVKNGIEEYKSWI
jgi:hypothetical protein